VSKEEEKSVDLVGGNLRAREWREIRAVARRCRYGLDLDLDLDGPSWRHIENVMAVGIIGPCWKVDSTGE
jgi:hypothetical protein